MGIVILDGTYMRAHYKAAQVIKEGDSKDIGAIVRHLAARVEALAAEPCLSL